MELTGLVPIIGALAGIAILAKAISVLRQPPPECGEPGCICGGERRRAYAAMRMDARQEYQQPRMIHVRQQPQAIIVEEPEQVVYVQQRQPRIVYVEDPQPNYLPAPEPVFGEVVEEPQPTHYLPRPNNIGQLPPASAHEVETVWRKPLAKKHK